MPKLKENYINIFLNVFLMLLNRVVLILTIESFALPSHVSPTTFGITHMNPPSLLSFFVRDTVIFTFRLILAHNGNTKSLDLCG